MTPYPADATAVGGNLVVSHPSAADGGKARTDPTPPAANNPSDVVEK